MIRQIVVHPGGAHKDDFLACALLIAEHEVAIKSAHAKKSSI